MGGWVRGEMEIKANLSQSLVEVEAELGKIASSGVAKFQQKIVKSTSYFIPLSSTIQHLRGKSATKPDIGPLLYILITLF